MSKISYSLTVSPDIKGKVDSNLGNYDAINGTLTFSGPIPMLSWMTALLLRVDTQVLGFTKTLNAGKEKLEEADALDASNPDFEAQVDEIDKFLHGQTFMVIRQMTELINTLNVGAWYWQNLLGVEMAIEPPGLEDEGDYEEATQAFNYCLDVAEDVVNVKNAIGLFVGAALERIAAAVPKTTLH